MCATIFRYKISLDFAVIAYSVIRHEIFAMHFECVTVSSWKRYWIAIGSIKFSLCFLLASIRNSIEYTRYQKSSRNSFFDQTWHRCCPCTFIAFVNQCIDVRRRGKKRLKKRGKIVLCKVERYFENAPMPRRRIKVRFLIHAHVSDEPRITIPTRETHVLRFKAIL